MLVLVALAISASSAVAEDVVVALTSKNFDDTVKVNKMALVSFYAPWCGHCKKMAPEYEKAAADLKPKNVLLAKVDATEEKDLATKYKVKGFPTLVWFEDGHDSEYDGGKTHETIVEWVTSMTGPAVVETEVLPPPADRPQITLYAPSLLASFEAAGKANRRKAQWYFVKDTSSSRVILKHKGEEDIELPGGPNADQEKLQVFLDDNILPLFGKLDGDTFDKYMAAGKGVIWSLFPPEGRDISEIEAQYRPMMTEVAKKARGRYFTTFTDTEKFKDAVDNMLSVTEFPAIAVQKKAGDKRKYVHQGEMTVEAISSFIADVDAARVAPKLKTEAVPVSNDEPIRIVVGQTMKEECFTADKDVVLEVYAPWCGHCKKLDPEYLKLGKKVKKEELSDLLTIAKLDGTANDSPIEGVDWTGFPVIYFVKAGNDTPLIYDGERTAKGLWKYIKKHATKAQEIRERVEKRKAQGKRGDEL